MKKRRKLIVWNLFYRHWSEQQQQQQLCSLVKSILFETFSLFKSSHFGILILSHSLQFNRFTHIYDKKYQHFSLTHQILIEFNALRTCDENRTNFFFNKMKLRLMIAIPILERPFSLKSFKSKRRDWNTFS